MESPISRLPTPNFMPSHQPARSSTTRLSAGLFRILFSGQTPIRSRFNISPTLASLRKIQGYDKNASLLWSEALPIEFGVTIVAYQGMEYTPAGDTLYFGTAGPYTATYEAQSYLYALDPL